MKQRQIIYNANQVYISPQPIIKTFLLSFRHLIASRNSTTAPLKHLRCLLADAVPKLLHYRKAVAPLKHVGVAPGPHRLQRFHYLKAVAPLKRAGRLRRLEAVVQFPLPKGGGPIEASHAICRKKAPRITSNQMLLTQRIGGPGLAVRRPAPPALSILSLVRLTAVT